MNANISHFLNITYKNFKVGPEQCKSLAFPDIFKYSVILYTNLKGNSRGQLIIVNGLDCGSLTTTFVYICKQLKFSFRKIVLEARWSITPEQRPRNRPEHLQVWPKLSTLYFIVTLKHLIISIF